MLDYLCFTSTVSTCQMGLFTVTASIVTRWSYFKLWRSDWQVSCCCCHVLSYLSHANIIYGECFFLSYLRPMEDWVPSCIPYVFRLLSALFWILWIQLELWRFVYSTSASVLWDVCIHILTDFLFCILYRGLIQICRMVVCVRPCVLRTRDSREAGSRRWLPTPSSPQVKERVEPYL